MHPLCLFSGVILILASIYISFQYISARINATRKLDFLLEKAKLQIGLNKSIMICSSECHADPKAYHFKMLCKEFVMIYKYSKRDDEDKGKLS